MGEPYCRICSRPSQSNGLCQWHYLALTILQEEYKKWNLAYGGMDWKKYLETVSKMKATGLWVKEVASSELHATIRETQEPSR